MTNIDKRFFYLMLSVAHGQEYAKSMGFSAPSKDVADVEIQDVYSRWGVFTLEGVHEEIDQCVDWFLEFLNQGSPNKELSEVMQALLTAFGMSLVNHLLDTQHISIILNGSYDGVLDE